MSTGAENDITQATSLLIAYVSKYGFDKETGAIDLSLLSENSASSDDLRERVRALCLDFEAQTESLLTEGYHMVEILAKRLLEEETLGGNEIEYLFGEI